MLQMRERYVDLSSHNIYKAIKMRFVLPWGYWKVACRAREQSYLVPYTDDYYYYYQRQSYSSKSWYLYRSKEPSADTFAFHIEMLLSATMFRPTKIWRPCHHRRIQSGPHRRRDTSDLLCSCFVQLLEQSDLKINLMVHWDSRQETWACIDGHIPAGLNWAHSICTELPLPNDLWAAIPESVDRSPPAAWAPLNSLCEKPLAHKSISRELYRFRFPFI